MVSQWDGVPQEVREAVGRWGRAVFAAPRVEELITEARPRDEVIARVLTTVARRELFEQKAPARPGEAAREGAIDASQLDPFAGSRESLRDATLRLVPCSTCRGSARVPCAACEGSGRARCPECSGSGSIRRYYKKSSRLIQCPGCRASGRVPCGACARSGAVACGACAATGKERSWWDFRETTATTVRFSADSTVMAAHPDLSAERPLTAAELGPFTVHVGVDCQGPIPPGPLLPEDEVVRARLTPAVDARRERVVAQQYVRFAARCVDVAYETCGARAVVTLSGAGLVGAITPDARRPIRRRVWLTLAAAVALAVAGGLFGAALEGPTAYFDAPNLAIELLLLGGVLAALTALWGRLRARRPTGPAWPLRTTERFLPAVAAALLLLAPAVRAAVAPSVSEARGALARGDLARARVVADALVATRSSGASALLDDLEVAEAGRLAGDARIAKLDAVAARNGARATEARAAARQARLDGVRASLASHQPAAALAQLDRSGQALAADADAQELRATALDAQVAACADDLCRFQVSRSAHAARPTPARAAQATGAKGHLLRTLAARGRLAEPRAAVRALRATTELADRAAADEDPDVARTAREAAAWAEGERAQIALLGAPQDAVDDLLGRRAGTAATTSWPDLQGVAVYPAVAADRCVGLYVVGAAAGARSLDGRLPGLSRLALQATGAPTPPLRRRGGGRGADAVTRWRQGRHNVVARWRGTALMELRIGEVRP
ncbi:MAG: hypothetical protein U0324_47190 [Polyangiales bacterium]